MSKSLADQPTWQSQPVGTGPGESILVNEGDAVVLSLSGSIVYKTELGGLRKLEADGWATDAECERCPMENRAVGALLCRIGADGAILTVTPDAPAFTAYRDGALQFMINDRHEAYGDNTGSLRVAVTVVRR